MNAKSDEISAADYPYDPAANIHELDGLERLRAITDRGVAQSLFELYWVAEAYERSPGYRRKEDAKLQRAAKERAEWLEAVEKAAKDGTFGEAGAKLAEMYGGQRLVEELVKAKVERRR